MIHIFYKILNISLLFSFSSKCFALTETISAGLIQVNQKQESAYKSNSYKGFSLKFEAIPDDGVYFSGGLNTSFGKLKLEEYPTDHLSSMILDMNLALGFRFFVPDANIGITPFLGVQSYLQTSKAKVIQKKNQEELQILDNDVKYFSFIFGLGFDWFLIPQLSLGFSTQYKKYKDIVMEDVFGISKSGVMKDYSGFYFGIPVRYFLEEKSSIFISYYFDQKKFEGEKTQRGLVDYSVNIFSLGFMKYI